jgi:4-aminobutyrate aminotransferase-like enzyme
LGYNHDIFVNARQTEKYDRFVTHKVNANTLPPQDFADLIRENVMEAAPNGMNQVHLGGGSTGTEANELALSVAMRHYAKQHGVTDLGSLCVLGFNNGIHGNSTGTLSCSSVDANP